MTRDELMALDELISPLIKKGQPLAHIMQEHEGEIPCSMRILYNYINEGYLTVRNLDMRRSVRYRKRRHYTEQPKISSKKKEGHLYKDYLKVLEENPKQRVVQMDTVAVIDMLEETLGIEQFRELFPVILTDNGVEFADPKLFETGKNGEKRSRVYYCEARRSEQKGELEKNHEYIRYILPKGSSFDELTQEKVRLMINHINNTTRPKLHGSTPMKQALKMFGINAMESLGLEVITPDDICLKPKLLK